MKIITIGPTYPYRGGISHYNMLLSENLNKHHQVRAISFKFLYPKFLFPGENQRDYTSKEQIKIEAEHLINSVNPFNWLNVFRRIKKEKADLIIFYWWTPFFAPMDTALTFLIKRFTKSKILFLCHNVVPHEKRKVDKILTKMSLKRADYFIVHSTEDMNELKKLLPKANVKLGFHPTYEIFKEIAQKTAQKGLKVKKNTILFFGFVRPYKGLMYLIKAMPKILKSIDLDLLIVGEFWKDKQEYFDEIKRLNLERNVKIVDAYVPNEEIGKYFLASDLVVLPYTSATNSGIIQTAFGFNKPVLVTNVGGLPETVSNNKTGYVVPTRNSDAIADAVISFYKENRSKEFVENIKKEKTKFSWDKMVELIEGFCYNRIVITR